MYRSNRPDRVPRRRAQRILEAYGGDPSNWPAGERAGMLAAAAGSRELAIRQESEAALDRILGQTRAPELSASLAARIRLRARGERAPGPVRGALAAAVNLLPEWPQMVRPTAALALAVVLGVAAAVALSPSRPHDADVAEQFLRLAFGHAYQVAENEQPEPYE